MKIFKYLTLTILLISLFACESKPEPNLQLFSPEAFAFDVGGSWEVNASVNAKGFEQRISEEYIAKSGTKILKIDDGYFVLDDKEKTRIKENSYHFKILYNVDLITPEKDTLKKIFSDSLASNQKNEFIDVPIEAQIELDTTFSIGNYKLVFEVIDKYSKQKKSAEVNFNLTTD